MLYKLSIYSCKSKYKKYFYKYTLSNKKVYISFILNIYRVYTSLVFTKYILALKKYKKKKRNLVKIMHSKFRRFLKIYI